MQDESVPYQKSLVLMERLATEEVELLYRKSADHRFSDSDCLDLIENSLTKLVEKI